MELDARIPLGVEQVDFANPLALLMQTRQNTQDRATAAQDRQREIARQATQDQQRNTELNQNSELNSAKIAEFKNSAATKQYMQDTLKVKNLLEANDERQAAMAIQAMQQRFKGTDYAKGLDEDFANIVNGNAKAVLSGINSEIDAFDRMEALTSGRAAAQAPAALQVFDRVSGMTPEEQELFFRTQRGAPSVNLGDRVVIPSQANPSGTPLADFPRGVSPDAQPSLQGQQEAAVQAARTDALPGQLAAENAAAIDQERQMATAPLQRDAQATLSLLDMAEPLLETATGSTFGNLRDQAGAMVGMSGEGAESAAQLKAIGGLLVSKMPRMQGPQSNLDVQLYREMAGQIGDPTVPNDVRRAAIRTIRELNQKYSGGTQSQRPAQPSQDIFNQADAIINGL